MKIPWDLLWKYSQESLIIEARTPLRIFRAWIERCTAYFALCNKRHVILKFIFNWFEFNITRKWKFKPVQ